MSRIDLTGKKFGKLKVLSLSHIIPNEYRVYWKCGCDCGNIKAIRGDGLLAGRIKTCGCSITGNTKILKCFRCNKEIRVIKTRWANYKHLYCSSACKINPNARSVSADGYYIIRNPKGGAIREHRLIMEIALKRKLKPTEIIHHINGNKLDNRIENLEITDRSKHVGQHRLGIRKKYCSRGHKYTIKNTYIAPKSGIRDCRKCMVIRKVLYLKSRLSA